MLFLRVATGFLLVWGGLSKLVNTSLPLQVGRNFELDAASAATVAYASGGAQLVIGALCVIGLWRRIMLPLQALIHGFTAISVWWAIIDPYRWYISGVDRIVFNSHVFYPTIITFAACVLLMTFRSHDTFAMDNVKHARQSS
jgi:uncharacterized membrane protein YphA (DoxX/SURF4 family)